MNDILIFSEENLLKQLDDAEYKLGFYRVRFYTRSGVLSNAKLMKSQIFIYIQAEAP